MLILDADGLIKLNRAGVLSLLASRYESAIPSAVHQEAVVNAQGRHPDVDAIGLIIELSINVVDVQVPDHVPSHIGLGEREVLALAQPTDTIISDDAEFLRVCLVQSTPFLTPADMILTMVDQVTLSLDQGKSAIGLLKPWINPGVYQRAIDILERS